MSKNKSRMRGAEHVARMEERIGIRRVLVGKPEEKQPLERHRHKWEDNIKMDLQEVVWGWDGLIWQGMDRWRVLVNEVMNLLVP